MRAWFLAATLIVAGIATLTASVLVTELERAQVMAASAAGAVLLLAGLMLIVWRRLKKPPKKHLKALVREAERDLKQALYDPVTGLLAQWYLELRLDEEVARARRYGLPLVVFTLDGSSGKTSKGKKSSAFGESEVIRAVTNSVRKTDLVASVGSSQFAACLLHCNRTGAMRVIRRLMEELGDGDWRLGIAVFPDDDYAGKDLINVANSRLMPWRAAPPQLKLVA
jgi:GGDEF domain-containing protein